MNFFLQMVISGLSIGIVYGVVALGIVLIWKSTGVFNFAQGALLLVGGYFAWTCISQWHFPLWAAFVLTMVICSIVCYLIQFLCFRPLIGQPHRAVVLVAIALIGLVEGGVLLVWKGVAQNYTPPIFPKEPLHLGEVTISQEYLWVLVMSTSFLIMLGFFFQRTRIGLAMRGTCEDHELAESVGISVETVFGQSWIIVGIISALIGITLSSLYAVEVGIAHIGLTAFAVVLVGGLESFPGAIAAGFIIGLAETLACGYINPIVGGGVRDIFPWIVAILFIVFFPHGLFGYKKTERV